MPSTTRQRPNSPGTSAAEGRDESALRAARRAAEKAAQAQRTAVRSADEIQAGARAEAERKAALPPWYMRKRYVLPAFLAGLLAVAGSSYIGSAPEPAPAVVAVPEPTVAAPSVGRTVEAGKFEFRLAEVRKPGATIGETFGSEKASGEWVVITVDVTNKATAQRTLDVSQQKLVDGQGNEYGASVVPSLPGWDKAYISGIAPKETTPALIAFDVPAGTVMDALVLTDTQFGKTVTVPLR